MKKRSKGKKFNLERDKREALLRNLAEALVRNEYIETTEPKAKELRPYIEKWVTKSRNNSLATRRELARAFTDKSANKLLNEIAPRYKNRPGGYTRIHKKGIRKHDATPMAIIEFVESSNTEESNNNET